MGRTSGIKSRSTYSNNDETNPSRALTNNEIENQNFKRAPCDCEPDEESAPEGGAVIQPVTGGAPSLAEGSLCMPSRSSVQLVSRGNGFAGWGMVFGASFELDNVETEQSGDKIGIDASLWDGLAVWLKRETNDPLPMFASVVDQYTVSAGGYCQDQGLLESACDAFGAGGRVRDRVAIGASAVQGVIPTRLWQRVAIDWGRGGKPERFRFLSAFRRMGRARRRASAVSQKVRKVRRGAPLEPRNGGREPVLDVKALGPTKKRSGDSVGVVASHVSRNVLFVP